MSPSISAAIIVRNEEAFLGDCLSSIRRDIDEIVIVDTGSTDSTVQIARRFGARVLEQPWADDFSAARNTALEHATRDWILYIDADERLTTPLGSTLRTCRLEDVVACRVLLRPRTGFTSYYELRLFRRDPRIRFRGIIHETVHPAIGSVCQSDGLRVLDTDIGLDHVGYD
ncbi:glycosyltransferase family 2 protein, partial [Escherichia coli]|uniref:glycosyltransferase family 2 protein n=1 Tax=Escherichia coli TaxID=562 RepID=UPI0021585DFB